MDYDPSFWNSSNRRKAVDFALNMVKDTQLEPGVYERMLLEQFVQGEITLEEVELLLHRELEIHLQREIASIDESAIITRSKP